MLFLVEWFTVNLLFEMTFVFWQDILEKFEFFPIKCLIQRAADVYQRALQANQQKKRIRPPKTKVKEAFNQTI